LTAFITVCFLTVSSHAQSVGSPPPFIRWETDLNVAMTRAEQENRPLFLHFCLPAQQMETEVFTQPNIASHLQANYVMVKINASENAALVQKFAVTAAPTDIVMRVNGQLIHRRVGGITADRFADYLAFLQKTIQSERNLVPPPSAPAPFPGMNVAEPSPPVPPGTAAQPGVMLPREMITTPDIMRDTFGGHQAPVAPTVSGTVPPPNAPHAFRSLETATRPAMDQTAGTYNVQNSPHVSMKETTPPVASAVAAVLVEPAPAKMTVEVPLALEGFCPVTLCSEERWTPGNPAYCTMYHGHIFRFASMETLVAFAQNPAKYIPIAMGEDIVFMVERNKRIEGNRKFGAWFQGRVFLFSCQETLNAFADRPEYFMEIALKYEIARREQPGPVVY